MNTIIEKIRAEVNRLKPRIRKICGEEVKIPVEKVREKFDTLLSFLSDLEKEEKPMNPQPVKIDIRKELASIEFMGVNDARDTETIARHFYALGQQSKEQPVDWQKVAEAHAKDQPLGQDNDGILVYLQEHPAYEDLEEYAQKVEDYYDVGEERGYLCTHRGDIKNAVIAGAKWGAEHSPLPDDLEEAAVEYSAIGYSPFDDPYEKHQQFECSKFAFIAGAKWQKAQSDKELSEKIASAYQLGLAEKEKQMMKEAVEGKVFMSFAPGCNQRVVSTQDVDLPCETKVKLIIIKED